MATAAPKKDPVIQKIYLPSDATRVEKKISNFLSIMGINAIDLKSTIE